MEVVFFDKQDLPQLACRRMKGQDEISTWEKRKQGTKLIFSSKFVFSSRVSPPDLDFPFI
jgi:hypothetical protein